MGAALPFAIHRAGGGELLRRRGQVVEDEVDLRALCEQGALVDADELAEAFQYEQPQARPLAPAELAAQWDEGRDEVRRALGAPPSEMAAAIGHVVDRVLGLIEQSPDLALSQVVRGTAQRTGHYGASHSIHAATACHAAARHLGWSAGEQRRAFQAALTMNVGMFELQARLADQITVLTTRQREAIHDHPLRGAETLRAAGIVDEDWLTAVLQHHEVPDGSGYPNGTNAVGELATMLRYADVYTARMSGRANRRSLSALEAGRGLLRIAANSPIAAALIKAFGIFPPGSLVKLASGELGVVTRNGEKAHHPLVAALTDASGEARPAPALRDSARREYAVVALGDEQALPRRLTNEQLTLLISGAQDTRA